VVGAIGTVHRMNPKRQKTRLNDGPFHHELKKIVRSSHAIRNYSGSGNGYNDAKIPRLTT
jgi:hypothetical protein